MSRPDPRTLSGEALREALNELERTLRPSAATSTPTARVRARAEAKRSGLAAYARALRIAHPHVPGWKWRPAHLGEELCGKRAQSCIKELVVLNGVTRSVPGAAQERDGLVRDAVDAAIHARGGGGGGVSVVGLPTAVVRADIDSAIAAIRAAADELEALPDEIYDAACDGGVALDPSLTRAHLEGLGSGRPARVLSAARVARRGALARGRKAAAALAAGGLFERIADLAGRPAGWFGAGEGAAAPLIDLVYQVCVFSDAPAKELRALRARAAAAGVPAFFRQFGPREPSIFFGNEGSRFVASVDSELEKRSVRVQELHDWLEDSGEKHAAAEDAERAALVVQIEQSAAEVAERDREIAALRKRLARAEGASERARAAEERARRGAEAERREADGLRKELDGARGEISTLARRLAEAERESAGLRARAAGRRPAAGAPSPRAPAAAPECAVCARPSDRFVAPSPCGHVSACEGCFSSLGRAGAGPRSEAAPPPTCPVCRAPVLESTIVYLSLLS